MLFNFSSSRKRRPSYSQDGEMFLGRNGDDQMNECSAALVLMSLSCSPHSPHQWAATATISTNGLGTSPGGSSTSSWSSSESSSLSDECATSTSSSSRIRTTSLSMSDEGIVMDYSDEMPRKRRVSHNIIYLICLNNIWRHWNEIGTNQFSNRENTYYTEMLRNQLRNSLFCSVYRCDIYL